MSRLSAVHLARLLRELAATRNAAEAARRCGVHPATAWRVARRHGIELTSLAQHLRVRRREAKFLAVQKPAQRKAAKAKMVAAHADPVRHRQLMEPLRRTPRSQKARAVWSMKMRARYDDPDFRERQQRAASAGMKRYHRAKQPGSEDTA